MQSDLPWLRPARRDEARQGSTRLDKTRMRNANRHSLEFDSTESRVRFSEVEST